MIESFQIFHFTVEIENRDPRYSQIINWLKDDFKDFPQTALSSSPRILKIQMGNFECGYRLWWFAKPSVTVFGWGRRKNYFYKTGVRLSVNFLKQRSAQIHGLAECVYETLYLLILSTVGEWLEDEGWVRLHALSFAVGDKVSVLIAPSGFGKSYLAEQMLNTPEVSVWGDEIALYKNGEVFSFPLRLTSKDSNNQAGQRYTFRQGERHKRVLLHRLLSYPNKKLDRAILVNSGSLSIMLGLGLPQMLEFRWRIDGFYGLAKALWNRVLFIRSEEIYKIRTKRLDLQRLLEIVGS